MTLPGGITDRDLDGPPEIPEHEICENCGHEYGDHHSAAQGDGCFWRRDEHAIEECQCEGFARRQQEYYEGPVDNDISF